MIHIQFLPSASFSTLTMCTIYSVPQSCPALCDPWTVAHQALLSLGFPRKEYWSGLPFPPPGDLPDPGIEPTFLASPALAGGFFISGRKPPEKGRGLGDLPMVTHLGSRVPGIHIRVELIAANASWWLPVPGAALGALYMNPLTLHVNPVRGGTLVISILQGGDKLKIRINICLRGCFVPDCFRFLAH